jgi:hypothetical protein
MPGPYTYSDSSETRLAVLKLAIDFLRDDEDTIYNVDDVLETANEFLNFVLKPE